MPQPRLIPRPAPAPAHAPEPETPDSATTLLRNLNASDADGVKIETMRLAMLDLATQQKALIARTHDGVEMAREAVIAATLVATNQRGLADDVERHEKEDERRHADVSGRLDRLSKSVGDLSEQAGRVLAELGNRAKVDSIHETEITNTRTLALATQRDLATVKAKAFAVRAVGVGTALGVYEAIKHWLFPLLGG